MWCGLSNFVASEALGVLPLALQRARSLGLEGSGRIGIRAGRHYEWYFGGFKRVAASSLELPKF